MLFGVGIYKDFLSLHQKRIESRDQNSKYRPIRLKFFPFRAKYRFTKLRRSRVSFTYDIITFQPLRIRILVRREGYLPYKHARIHKVQEINQNVVVLAHAHVIK